MLLPRRPSRCSSTRRCPGSTGSARTAARRSRPSRFRSSRSRRRTTRGSSRTSSSRRPTSASASSRSSANRPNETEVTVGGGASWAPPPIHCGRKCDTVTDTPTLELRGITKSFGSVQALADVDFEVRAGEVMALVGDNGAGKSTLVKVVAGIHAPDSGEILFEGKPVHIHSPKEASRLGVEVVYQDLALCDNLDVVQNMFLGREERDWLWRLKEPAMEQRTAETLRGLSVTTIRSIRQPVASLSGGQRQSVAVAKAVLWNSKLVILDEPTAALGVAQTRQVLDLVKRLGEQGLAVVLVSHNMSDVFEVADNITVLRLGQNVAEFKRTETTQREVVEAITAGELHTVPGMQEVAIT